MDMTRRFVIDLDMPEAAWRTVDTIARLSGGGSTDQFVCERMVEGWEQFLMSMSFSPDQPNPPSQPTEPIGSL
jgi:hypothetical protein